MLLNRSRTLETGASIIEKHSGQRPQYADTADRSIRSTSPAHLRQTPKRWSQPQNSPGRSPARFGTPQKQIESIFQEVSGNLQRRTEGWSVSKAVRGAVGEVRKNMNSLQPTHSRGPSMDAGNSSTQDTIAVLQERINLLEGRQRALSTMLDGALKSLRACKPGSTSDAEKWEDAFNTALAKLQFVSVYLGDSEIPIHSGEDTPIQIFEDQADTNPGIGEAKKPNIQVKDEESEQPKLQASAAPKNEIKDGEKNSDTSAPTAADKSAPVRPSLADSSFSFMLGENRHRSSFVSSVTALPEQRRDSTSRSRPNQIVAEKAEKRERRGSKDKGERKVTAPEDHGFTMSSFQ